MGEGVKRRPLEEFWVSSAMRREWTLFHVFLLLCGSEGVFYFCLPEEHTRRPLIRGGADILTGTRSRFDVLEGAGCGLWVPAGLTMLH